MDRRPVAYVSRAIDIYREQGTAELAKRGTRFAAARAGLLRKRVVGEFRLRRHGRGSTDSNPYTRKWVDPTEIEYVLATRLEPRSTGRHFELVRRPAVVEFADYGDVVGGAWDRERVSLSAYSEWELVVRRFVDGVDWEELALYDECLERIRNGGQIWGCTSASELHERFAYLDRLHDSIASDGYKRNTNPDDSIGTGSVGPAELDEVTVGVAATARSCTTRTGDTVSLSRKRVTWTRFRSWSAFDTATGRPSGTRSTPLTPPKS